MVAKKSRIAQNPKTKFSPQATDEWINEGGTDPELTVEAKSPAPLEQPKPTDSDDQGKKYPHRISFDMDKAQYKRLKFSAFDSDRSMNEILREAVEEWMNTRSY